ncbi:MAG: glycosyl transferase, partial [Candidatus Cloacimonetes bacterium]|nr:glycosyl transferase [Candidatus Cloacimonadota bacterium]
TAVLTTGPPHSTHLIGLKLHKRLGIRWCTDFRDPWADIYYLKLNPPSAFTMRMHKRLEKKVIANSFINFIVSRSIAEALPAGRKEVLYNGFDPQDFRGLAYSRSQQFRIKFVGQLTAGQDASVLIEALADLNGLSELQFSLIGTRDFPANTLQVRRLPFIPHNEAIKELVEAELLVLFINSYEGNKGMLTTKLFEYIASRSPILCIAAKGGEAEELITRCNCGVVLQEKAEIREHISKLYSLWKEGAGLRTTADISFLDVNVQAQKLNLINP